MVGEEQRLAVGSTLLTILFNHKFIPIWIKAFIYI